MGFEPQPLDTTKDVITTGLLLESMNLRNDVQ